MIPKIIWQTHQTPYEQLPEFQKKIIGTWKDLNPTWEHRYIDAASRSKYVEKYDNNLFEKYQNSHPIAQSDMWRALVIYEHGGFYADMDSICILPLDEILNKGYNNQDVVCSPIAFQCEEYEVNNSNFGAVKNSKIIKYILSDISVQSNVEYIPNTYWHNFSNNFIDHSNQIYFDNTYFLHSEDYKIGYN